MSDHPFTHAAFQQHLDNGELIAARCQSCGALLLPPQPLCPQCYGQDLESEVVGGRGKLIAFTAVHIAPTAMVKAGYGPQNPYVTGIVQLEEGPAISAQIIGIDAKKPEDISIGATVELTFLEREGSEHKALAFKVVS